MGSCGGGIRPQIRHPNPAYFPLREADGGLPPILAPPRLLSNLGCQAHTGPRPSSHPLPARPPRSRISLRGCRPGLWDLRRPHLLAGSSPDLSHRSQPQGHMLCHPRCFGSTAVLGSPANVSASVRSLPTAPGPMPPAVLAWGSQAENPTSATKSGMHGPHQGLAWKARLLLPQPHPGQ